MAPNLRKQNRPEVGFGVVAWKSCNASRGAAVAPSPQRPNRQAFAALLLPRPPPLRVSIRFQQLKVVDELSESIERERVRGHDARMLLEGAVSKGGVVLPEVRPAP